MKYRAEMYGHRLAAVLLVFVVAVSASPVAYSLVVLESSVERLLSNVYGLEAVTLPSWMVYTHYEVAGSRIILGGRGYVASLDLEKLRIERSLAVIGDTTSLSLDSSSARFVAVGSSSGETLVLDYRDFSLIARFYTATRAPVKSAYIAETGTSQATGDLHNFRLIVLDEEGFLYIMRITRGLVSGWFEAGPVSNLGSVTGLYGFRVQQVVPLKELEDWHSYRYLGDRIISLTDIKLPELPAFSPFLGSAIVRVYYNDSLRGLIEAYTGVFEPDVLGAPVEERYLYYIVSWGSYLLPLPQPRASAFAPVYYGSNASISLANLPPDSYRLRVLYEVIVRDRETRVVLSRERFMGELYVRIKSSDIVYENLTLSRVECRDIVEKCLLGGERLYAPSLMQGLLVLDSTRLPFVFEYEADGRLLLLPISRQMADLGVRDLANFTLAAFIQPKSLPPGWSDLGVRYVAVFGVNEWLAIYYLEEGFRLAEVGYEQPQLIYLGSRPTSLVVSSDARVMLLGTERGLVFRVNWLRGLDAVRPTGSADRYYLDSALSIGSAPVTSIKMLSPTRALVSLADGRLQLIDIHTWTPLWRGPPGYEGIDTGLSGIAVDLAGPYVVAVSKGSNKIHVFRERLDALHPLVVNIIVVTYDDKGDWYIYEPPFDISLALVEVDKGTLAAAAATRRLAIFYMPVGLYNLTIHTPGASRPVVMTVAVGVGLNVRNILLIYYPGLPLQVETIDADRTIESIMRFYPPRATITLRFIGVDGEPVLEPLRVTLVGPAVYITDVANGTLRLPGMPPGEYRVQVSPLTPLYAGTMASIRVTMVRTTPDVIVVPPGVFQVVILLRDVDTNGTVTLPYRVTLERLGAGSMLLVYPRALTVTGSATVELPAGTYRIRVDPVSLDVYERPREVIVEVKEPKTIVIDMVRKRYNVELRILDAWGRAMEGAKVEFVGLDIPLNVKTVSGRDGKVRVELPYGHYDILVTKTFYRRTSDILVVESDVSKNIVVEPGPIAVLIRYSPFIVGALALALAGVAFLRVRKIIAERLGEEEF